MCFPENGDEKQEWNLEPVLITLTGDANLVNMDEISVKQETRFGFARYSRRREMRRFQCVRSGRFDDKYALACILCAETSDLSHHLICILARFPRPSQALSPFAFQVLNAIGYPANSHAHVWTTGIQEIVLVLVLVSQDVNFTMMCSSRALHGLQPSPVRCRCS